MQLIIDISKNNPELILKRANKIIARHSWHGHLDLSEKLLPAIDKFLKKQGMTLQHLKKITARQNKKSFMNSSIALVTANVLSWIKNSTLL